MGVSRLRAEQITSAEHYKGGNEFIDKYLIDTWEGETWWIVQGPGGRRPIMANTKDGAIEDYLDRFYGEDEERDWEAESNDCE